MTGLIVKDFLILRKTMRTYLLMTVLYTALSLTGAWGPEMLSGFLMVIVAMLPMNVFAYDKQAKWDTYGLALPISRTKTVASRYITVLLLCLFSLILVVFAGIVLGAMGHIEDFGTYVLSGTILGLLAIIGDALLLPVLYKFGPEQARIVLFGFFGLIGFGMWLFLMPLKGVDWLESLNLSEPTPAQVAAVPVIAAIAGVVLLALSFLRSRHFYGSKDI